MQFWHGEVGDGNASPLLYNVPSNSQPEQKKKITLAMWNLERSEPRVLGCRSFAFHKRKTLKVLRRRSLGELTVPLVQSISATRTPVKCHTKSIVI